MPEWLRGVLGDLEAGRRVDPNDSWADMLAALASGDGDEELAQAWTAVSVAIAAADFYQLRCAADEVDAFIRNA